MTGSLLMPRASVEFVLRLGDDNLIIAQRLAEWSSRAHDLEDDIALTNIGLDHLGQARALLTYVGDLEGNGRSEDDLAFHRSEREFVNRLLVEQANGDFAQTIVRQLFWSAYQLDLWEGLTRSADDTVAAIASKAIKEARYHYEYAGTWALRLGDGTAESHERMQAAVDRLWRLTDEPFEMDDVAVAMEHLGVGINLADLAAPWRERIAGVLSQATLVIPEDPYRQSGGRAGMHSSEFGFLLAEIQHLPRSLPTASW
jgi:ring-1,2-phenylacetyl-CoA epoxidase subunit PaaC